MKKTIAAESPDAYVASLRGWRADLVSQLRAHVLAAGRLEEVIKWGHLVYFSNGPVLLIRAQEECVLFGFWRGQRLREIDNRLKPGGKYEMATIALTKESEIKATQITKLVKQAIALNKKLGDPTDIG
jgi:hypothetical protein